MQAREPALPFLPFQLCQRSDMRVRNAGVVDQAVEPPETFERGGDQARGMWFARSVGTHEGAAARQCPVLQAGLARIGIQIANHHAAAGTEHSLRNAAANPLRTTGDDHHAVLQRCGIPVGNSGNQSHGVRLRQRTGIPL